MCFYKYIISNIFVIYILVYIVGLLPSTYIVYINVILKFNNDSEMFQVSSFFF